MKAATVSEIKRELKTKTTEELSELCLRLSKFKKENKELLTYLLYEAADEESYIQSVKTEMDDQFEEINITSYYFIKKSVRKILRTVKKYIRYSPHKTTEVELLIYFCSSLKEMSPSISRNVTLQNLYDRQLTMIRKKVSTLDADLQYDYGVLLDNMEGISD
ncbi:hypothetical protein [Marinoscillum sp. 108]|jgi:hypothetical protein|uniref:hypothetical protein n=1 Tax=Marinoscillum sp. 108 TaxID=2653151 RepID=UPI0012F2C3B8|nr:hypothetical protein [Marinoscillum sp. 108]VXD13132.1 conserved hypothetical protein [Marinoscillum sp. 108]